MIPLIPGKYFHIYNRANGDERAFRSTENYRFFLEKYNYFVTPVADTFCFCLMPNHFHFLVRIKTEKEILQDPEGLDNSGSGEIDKVVSAQFSRFFNSYVKAFNKQHNRMGSLFIKNFKRKLVDNELYLAKLVHYIHNNPVEAGLSGKPGGWKHSSYGIILSEAPTFLKREEVIEWFGSAEDFQDFHTAQPELGKDLI
jgi:putative transposase